MAISNYKERAQDSLDILLVADIFIAKVKKTCKAAVAHTISKKMSCFAHTKVRLESQLKVLTKKVGNGFFAKLKYRTVIRELKAKLSEVNRQIVDWINSTYRYFFATPVLMG